MTPEQLDDIESREQAARDHIRDLCLGKARWTMRVPADPQHDSDLVISRSLADVPALVAEVRRLREVLRGSVPLPTSDDTTFTEQADYGSDAR